MTPPARPPNWPPFEATTVDQTYILTRRLLGRSLARQEFESFPTDDQWDVELSHQVADPGTPGGALEIVVRVVAELLGW